MNTPTHHIMTCNKLPDFETGDWDAINNAFSRAESCSLGQSWLSDPQMELQATVVRTGWRDGSLWFYGQMNDLDIFNAATKMNQETWKLGDVMEIFLRAPDASEYYEFHITPENHILQTRWPIDGRVVALRGKSFQDCLISETMLRTWTHVDHAQNQWRALAALKSRDLGIEAIVPGLVCDFSFCRYDATRGQATPIISSSSPHTKPDFHRYHEWSKLHVEVSVL